MREEGGLGSILGPSPVLPHNYIYLTAFRLLPNLFLGCDEAPGCSPPCLQDFWFLGVPQYISFWHMLVAMDLCWWCCQGALSCSCPLKQAGWQIFAVGIP